MFNQETRYPNNFYYQEDDEFDGSDEQEYYPHGDLDDEVRNIRQAAFESCITSIGVEEDYTLFNGIWNKVEGMARKRWFQEAAIIAAILIFRTGLFISYREAHKANLKITLP